MARLSSTGRKPALTLEGVEALLSAYFDDDDHTVEALAARFELTTATVRKYLRLALGPLPRGRAACLPKAPRNVKALVNGIPTEALLGDGRVELLLRRRADGASLTALAATFGISRDRVTKLVRASFGPPEADSGQSLADVVEQMNEMNASEAASAA